MISSLGLPHPSMARLGYYVTWHTSRYSKETLCHKGRRKLQGRFDTRVHTREVGSDGVAHVLLAVGWHAILEVDEDACLVGWDLVDEDRRRLHEDQLRVVVYALGTVLEHQTYNSTAMGVRVADILAYTVTTDTAYEQLNEQLWILQCVV